MFHSVALTYAFSVNFIPSYRKPIDDVSESGLGLGGKKESDPEGDIVRDEKSDSLDKGEVAHVEAVKA
jgi:hypothetical protein